MNRIVKVVLFGLVILLLSLGIIGFLLSKNETKIIAFYKKEFNPEITSISLKNNVLTVSLNNTDETIYYNYSKQSTIPSTNDSNWKKVDNNSFSFEMDDNIYHAYLKNQNNEIKEINGIPEVGNITKIEVNKKDVYLALNDSFKLDVNFESVGKVDKTITYYSENDKIADVNEKGKITAKKKGNTKIHIKVGSEDIVVNVTSTNLITKKPKNFNNNKKYLSCGKYSKEENDLLDKILKDRIYTVGYKTRAATVEAARFLALEFPYKITYFSENGRGNTNGVDGEGRFYHKGLYLHKSRYKIIKKTINGPKPWGCKIYSVPAHGQRSNGFDCSGFISWVLYNAGFNVGDIGAGLAPHKDLTDYGKRTVFTKKVVKSGKIKVGDLLSSGGPGGGHIAIIVGEDKKNYYVAESLWTSPTIGVVIKKYSKNNIYNVFYYVMLMDDYYKKDGNITNMWY